MKSAEKAIVERVVDTLSTSSSVQMACQKLVCSPNLNGAIKSAHIYTPNSFGELRLLTGYGKRLDTELLNSSEFSVNNDNHQELRLVEIRNQTVACIPLLLADVPVATLFVTLQDKIDEYTFDKRALILAQRVAGLFVLRMPLQSTHIDAPHTELPPRFKLTERHHAILELMGQGLSNGEIGKALLVSESTVRQENIKIFRYLGVKTRQDAVEKAFEGA